MLSWTSSAQQAAAIPYRGQVGTLEVLLVTSRRRRRWVLPKGGVKWGTRPYVSAAREAREEAGVVGHPAPDLVGTYRQAKVAPDGTTRMIVVRAYALAVTSVLEVWPEMRQRERKWFPLQDAIIAVRDRELRSILLRFAALQTGIQ